MRQWFMQLAVTVMASTRRAQASDVILMGCKYMYYTCTTVEHG